MQNTMYSRGCKPTSNSAGGSKLEGQAQQECMHARMQLHRISSSPDTHAGSLPPVGGPQGMQGSQAQQENS